MFKKLELIGKRFGRLVVLEDVGRKNRCILWKCQCDCGNLVTIRGGHLRKGNTKSCGCLAKENRTKHGMFGTSEYAVWGHIIQRCNNPNDSNYKHYGGRGIKVSDRWLKFENFYEDMGECPKGLTIERKNNELGYFKGNCCWDTRQAQSRNRRIQRNNKTGIKGVYFSKQRQRYCAQIKVNFKQQHVGYYKTIEEAAAARKAAELKYW